MYTVIRFQSELTDDTLLSEIGQRLNERRPGTFGGMDCVDGRFSCSLSNASDLENHIGAITTFLDDFEDILKQARKSDVELELDIAVDPEDRAKRRTYFVIRLPAKLLERIASAEISLVLTYYLVDGGA
jgi:hypothetical protein